MMQIDIIDFLPVGIAIGNLYTDNRCVRIYIQASDYQQLIADKFFIRDGKEKDSANVINTTAVYRKEFEK